MTNVIRWTFTDGASNYTFPVNPSDMTSTGFARTKSSTPSIVRSMPLGLAERTQPVEWSFSGKIYTQQQYDDLLAWSQIDRPIVLTDHLNRSFLVVIKRFSPTDFRTRGTTIRWKYEISALILSHLGIGAVAALSSTSSMTVEADVT